MKSRNSIKLLYRFIRLDWLQVQSVCWGNVAKKSVVLCVFGTNTKSENHIQMCTPYCSVTLYVSENFFWHKPTQICLSKKKNTCCTWITRFTIYYCRGSIKITVKLNTCPSITRWMPSRNLIRSRWGESKTCALTFFFNSHKLSANTVSMVQAAKLRLK